MTTSRAYDVDLPVDFDVASYDVVADYAIRMANPNDPAARWNTNAWFGFGTGWLGFAMRLRSAMEFNEEFGILIAASPSPGRAEQYKQERALFACITAALSSMECFSYATYCLAGAFDDKHFPLSDKRKLRGKSGGSFVDKFKAFNSLDPFVVRLDMIWDASEFDALSDLRNALSHRGTLPRKVWFSTVSDLPDTVPFNPKALAENFVHDSPLTAEATAGHVLWVTTVLSELTTEFAEFLMRHT